MPPRHNVQVRVNALLYFIQSHQPTHEEIRLKMYGPGEAARQKFQRDLRLLREEYEVVQDDQHRYALLETATTNTVLDLLLEPADRALLQRLKQEFGPGHPFGLDLRLLLDKLAGRLTTQQQQLAESTPTRYLGRRFSRDYTRYRPLLEQLEQAIKQMRRIRFINLRPVSRDREEVAHLEVEPQFLELRNGTFYLYGYNMKSQKCFHYRVDKIKDLQLLPDKFGALRNLEAQMIEFEYIVAQKVAKGGVSERFHHQEIIAMLPDGRAHMRACDHEFWVKQELLRMGSTVQLVAGPPSLLTALKAEIEGMHQLYQNEKEKAD